MITKIELRPQDTRYWNVYGDTYFDVYASQLPSGINGVRLSIDSAAFAYTGFEDVDFPEVVVTFPSLTATISSDQWELQDDGTYKATESVNYRLSEPNVYYGTNPLVALTVTTASSEDDLFDGQEIATTPEEVTVSYYNTISGFSLSSTQDDFQPGDSETKQIRMTDRPLKNIEWRFEDDKGLFDYTPSSMIFTPEDYDQTRSITVTANKVYVNYSSTSYLSSVIRAIQVGEEYPGNPEPAQDSLDSARLYSKGGNIVPNPSSEVSVDEYDTLDINVSLSHEIYGDADVNVSVQPQDTSAFTTSVTTLAFDKYNWNIPQTITLTPSDDSIYTRDMTGTLLLRAGSYTTNYGKYISINVEDQDVPEVTDTGGGRMKSFRIQSDGFVFVPEGKYWAIVDSSGEGYYKRFGGGSSFSIRGEGSNPLYLQSGAMVGCDDDDVSSRLEITYFEFDN